MISGVSLAEILRMRLSECREAAAKAEAEARIEKMLEDDSVTCRGAAIAAVSKACAAGYEHGPGRGLRTIRSGR